MCINLAILPQKHRFWQPKNHARRLVALRIDVVYTAPTPPLSRVASMGTGPVETPPNPPTYFARPEQVHSRKRWEIQPLYRGAIVPWRSSSDRGRVLSYDILYFFPLLPCPISLPRNPLPRGTPIKFAIRSAMQS